MAWCTVSRFMLVNLVWLDTVCYKLKSKTGNMYFFSSAKKFKLKATVSSWGDFLERNYKQFI